MFLQIFFCNISLENEFRYLKGNKVVLIRLEIVLPNGNFLILIVLPVKRRLFSLLKT